MLPALGGPLLGAYGADRLPRKRVLIACDLVRAVLVAVLVTPACRSGLAIGLLYVLHLFRLRSRRHGGVYAGGVGGRRLCHGQRADERHLPAEPARRPGGRRRHGDGHSSRVRWPSMPSPSRLGVLIVSAVRARPARPGALPAHRVRRCCRTRKDGARYVFSDPGCASCLLVVGGVHVRLSRSKASPTPPRRSCTVARPRPA